MGIPFTNAAGFVLECVDIQQFDEKIQTFGAKLKFFRKSRFKIRETATVHK